MKAIAFKAHFLKFSRQLLISIFSLSVFVVSNQAAMAQSPGAPDKNKPTIPLSPSPTLGPKPQSAPPAAANDKPAAQSGAAVTSAPALTSVARPANVVAAVSGAKMASTANGAKFQDSTIGTGAVASSGQTVSVHYTGWLMEGGKLGRKFDSSIERGQPFKFPLGNGRVIKGWDEGIVGMRVGGTRVLTVPPELGYGTRGAGSVIPPGATLVFEVKLLGV
jgi:peptidylprolyl isomerase